MTVMRMMTTTRNKVEAYLEIDHDITPEERKHLKRALGNRKGIAKPEELTTKEACELLECHAMTLYRYEKKGLIKGKRLSKRRLRWDKDDILDLKHNGVDID